MHLWNTKKLVEELRSGTMSEAEKTRYYILTLLAFVLFGEILYRVPREPDYSAWSFATLCGTIGSTVIGTLLAQRRNADGKDFIARAVCLSVPIGVKVFALFMLLLVSNLIMFHLLGWVEDSGYTLQEEVFFFVSGLGIDFLFFFRLIRNIEAVSEGGSRPALTAPPFG